MAKCEACGNEYKRTFTVQLDNDTHIFDTFECAIQSLAPRCARCEVVIIGHGVEGDDEVFCGAHCARAAGETGAVDNVA